MQPDPLNRPEANLGQVVSVRGSVVDALFLERLPPLNNLLRTGKDGNIVIEVINHQNSQLVRGIALTPTRGLALGSQITDTGHPIKVPVGERLLGRVFNVFGEAIDGKEEVSGGD